MKQLWRPVLIFFIMIIWIILTVKELWRSLICNILQGIFGQVKFEKERIKMKSTVFCNAVLITE